MFQSLLEKNPTETIHLLAFLSLFGLLLSAGLEMGLRDFIHSVRRQPLIPTLSLNFVMIPVVGVVISRFMKLDFESSQSLMLLAAAPFAPVVPLFVGMSRGNQVLASSFTGIIPFFSGLFTPAALSLGFWLGGIPKPYETSPIEILGATLSSITLPLFIGTLAQQKNPKLAGVLQKPIGWLAEIAGILSLACLIYVERSSLIATTSDAAASVVLFAETSFMLGWLVARHDVQDRIAMAFGSSNRNIGLGIFLATNGAGGNANLSPILSTSLLILGCGLINVAVIRTFSGRCTLNGRP